MKCWKVVKQQVSECGQLGQAGVAEELLLN